MTFLLCSVTIKVHITTFMIEHIHSKMNPCSLVMATHIWPGVTYFLIYFKAVGHSVLVCRMSLLPANWVLLSLLMPVSSYVKRRCDYSHGAEQ